MVTSLRSKWAVGKARGGRISKSIRNRSGSRLAAAGQPPAHFQRNPLGRGQLAVFPSGGCRTRSARMDSDMGARSRLEKQPTDLRRRHHYMRDGALVRQKGIATAD